MEVILVNLIIACLAATAATRRIFGDAVSSARGNGRPRHERWMQQRQQDHERRMAALKYRHDERLKGVGGPTVGEAVAERLRRGPKSYEDMHPWRRWWYDQCADTAQRLTDARRERYRRTDAGEQPWQKLRDRAAERARRAAQQWRDRHQPQDPHRQWWDSERVTDPPPARPATDRPDPGAPDTTPVDAEVVDEQRARPRRAARPELEPGWPEPPTPENPPGTAAAVAGRIPEPLGSTPADHTTSTQGDTPMTTSTAAEVETARGGNPAVPRHSTEVSALNGETVDPESLGSFADGMQQVAAAMAASIEASIANLESLGVSGGPINDLVAMADAAAVLAGRSQSTAAHAASHRDIQGVAQSDPTVGGETYLGIGAAAR